MQLYRFLTDDDTSAFCHKVTLALSKGWVLQGGPTYGFDALFILLAVLAMIASTMLATMPRRSHSA